MSKPQFSKRERARKQHHREPTYGYCPDCQRPIWNKGAHAEECDGIPLQRCEAYTYSAGAFGVKKQCVRAWAHEGGHIY
jgi:hypothetical protein